MIDFSSQIFTAVASGVRNAHPETKMIGEYVRRPSDFPTVTLDEISNVVVDRLEDSSQTEKFVGVIYRLQVFSNKQNGKRAEARTIFATADAEMRKMGFRRVTYTSTPEIYDSTIYSITATYEGVISTDGYVYKRNI